MKKIYSTGWQFALTTVMALGVAQLGSAQTSQTVYRAEKLYEIGNYEQALSSYLSALEQGENSAYLHYKVGATYLQQKKLADKLKALHYLNLAKSTADELPSQYWIALGEAYQLNAEPNLALEAYTKFEGLANDDVERKQAKAAKLKAQLAIELMANPKNIVLTSPAANLNTLNTEYNPIVSADESIMAYTQLIEGNGRGATKEQIMLMRKQNGQWSAPETLKFGSFNAGTAGISADGQTMIIYLQDNTGGNLYTIHRKGDAWGQPQKINGDVNSRYTETTASLSADGQTLYFASDRPGGSGGLDIYKAKREANGNWGRAENLGPEVNTADNEDAPYIHPNGITLFYTTNGQSSIGGNDILRTDFVAGKWTAGRNLGYPLNTVANESYFTVTADGSRAYFASDRAGGQGGQDVYTFNMPEEDRNIPLTLMKGRILAGLDEKPVPTTMYVVDVQTGNKIDYVYNPDPETGNYLIVLPPGRNYDIIVKAEGYLPYSINVNIPNQDYFYELYQQVFLRPVKQFDVVVGQEVEVKNAFYDTGQPMHHDLKKIRESNMVQSDSVDIFEMMETIIGAGDSDAFEYVLELMYEVNPIENVEFAEDKNEKIEDAGVVYYYEENDKTKLEAKKIGDEVIYTLPTFYVSDEAKRQENKPLANFDKSILSPVHKIYFDSDSKSLKSKDEALLNTLLQQIKAADHLGLEISGYASTDGDAAYNNKLSNERANSVLTYLNERGVLRRKIIARGYGATESATSNAQEGRRVEVRVVELDKIASK